MDDPQKLGTIHTTSIVPVDLNALMFKMEKLLARASQGFRRQRRGGKYEDAGNPRVENHREPPVE